MRSSVVTGIRFLLCLDLNEWSCAKGSVLNEAREQVEGGSQLFLFL